MEDVREMRVVSKMPSYHPVKITFVSADDHLADADDATIIPYEPRFAIAVKVLYCRPSCCTPGWAVLPRREFWRVVDCHSHDEITQVPVIIIVLILSHVQCPGRLQRLLLRVWAGSFCICGREVGIAGKV
jgi:hypothetical protein